MSSSIYTNDEGVVVVTKKRYGDSDISLQIHAERQAKTKEWESDAELIFKDTESLKKHAKELSRGLTSNRTLTNEQREYLDFYVCKLIDSIPEHLRNVKHISYVNRVIQSGVAEYLENSK